MVAKSAHNASGLWIHEEPDPLRGVDDPCTSRNRLLQGEAASDLEVVGVGMALKSRLEPGLLGLVWLRPFGLVFHVVHSFVKALHYVLPEKYSMN